VGLHSVKYQSNCTAGNAKGFDDGSVHRLPTGAALIGHCIKVDPFKYGCIVSIQRERNSRVGNHDGLIPEKFRPYLSYIKDLLRPAFADRLENHKRPGFSLVPMDKPDANGFGNLDRDIQDENYRIVGFLNSSVEKATELFSNSTCRSFDLESWIPLSDAYPIITRKASKQVKKIHGAICLSDSEILARQTPIVESERFKAASDFILKAFLKPTCNAVLLRGKAGVGKSCLVSYLVHRYMRMCVPPRLQGYLVAGLGTELFMPSNYTAEEAEKSKARALMAKHKVIWVIDEASRLVDRGNTAALDNLLLFIDLGAKLILLSDQSYLLERREAFTRRLSPVHLPPADPEESKEIATIFAHHQSQATGLVIAPQAVQTAVKYSYASPYAQPHAVTSLLTGTIAGVEACGEKLVTSECVIREFQQMYSQGNSIPEIPARVEAFIDFMRTNGYRGHEGFLNHFGTRLLSGLRRRFRPDRKGVVWSCLVVGNSGNGKTMLLEIVARMITGSESKVMTIRCSAYQKPHAVQSLIGSPKSYIGYEEGGALQNFIKSYPDGVLLIEEPELGHPNVMQLLMEILEGSFTAGDGSVICTRGLTVLLSSNAGCEANKATPGFAFSVDTNRAEHIKKACENMLPPPIRSRMGPDNLFYLPPLSVAALRNILRQDAATWSRAEGIDLEISDAVIHDIVEKENNALCGARPVKDRFCNDVESLLNTQLIKYESQNILKIKVFLDDHDSVQCEVKLKNTASPPEDDLEPINGVSEKK
jgi:Cdc6-like AAA superfamily ATPase